jgi:ABC-type tungstate transport system substrate-binding protein
MILGQFSLLLPVFFAILLNGVEVQFDRLSASPAAALSLGAVINSVKG